MAQALVFVKQLQTVCPVYLRHVALQFVASAENSVELVIAETYKPVVLYGAPVVYLADVRPHACAKAHVARLACGVEFAIGQVVRAEPPAGFPYGVHLAVASGVAVEQHLVVTGANEYAIPHDGGAKRAAMAVQDAFASLVDGYFHVFVLCHRVGVFMTPELRHGVLFPLNAGP